MGKQISKLIGCNCLTITLMDITRSWRINIKNWTLFNIALKMWYLFCIMATFVKKSTKWMSIFHKLLHSKLISQCIAVFIGKPLNITSRQRVHLIFPSLSYWAWLNICSILTTTAHAFVQWEHAHRCDALNWPLILQSYPPPTSYYANTYMQHQ